MTEPSSVAGTSFCRPALDLVALAFAATRNTSLLYLDDGCI